jgi:hypothetical protein
VKGGLKMKNTIVTIGEILLGVIVFTLIFGANGSIRAEANRMFQNMLTQTATVHSFLDYAITKFALMFIG